MKKPVQLDLNMGPLGTNLRVVVYDLPPNTTFLPVAADLKARMRRFKLEPSEYDQKSLTDCSGQLIFDGNFFMIALEQYSEELLAHEASHAATRMIEYLHIQEVGGNELHAFITGYICGEVADRLRKHRKKAHKCRKK